MLLLNKCKRFIGHSLVMSVLLAGCGSSVQHEASTKVVDVDQTQVKWQSIGNCWVYAAIAWVESQVLKHNGIEVDFSESYISYRHFEIQLLSRRNLTEIQTGGFWRESKELILDFGLIQEGDFIPDEAESTYSAAQEQAVRYLNESLASGLLKTDRSPRTVRAELDAAFGVTLAEVEDKILPASRIKLGFHEDGSPRTLAEEISGWRRVNWPRDWSSTPQEDELPIDSTGLTFSQRALLKRVKKSLNDGHPVVLNWWVDFNGLDDEGIFSLERVRELGPGRQGYHQTVIEDYVVSGISPQTGEIFLIGEGEATAEEKQLALEHGEIVYFVVKNSWGGAERLNRPSYSRFGEKGYTRLDASYLFGLMKKEEDGEFRGVERGLTGFILPPGY